jgi:hypothetical protein
MTRLTLISLALGLFGLTGIAQAQPASGWLDHRNEKYGFSLKYPGDIFKPERTTEAGDGHAFVSMDGKARLLVGVLENTSGFTPATYQDHVAQQSYGRFKVTYRPLGKSWFALSGEGNDQIFYEKVIFSCSGRLINSFAMIYPVDRRDVFDPLVERIEDSFQAGAACDRASAPVAKSKRPSAGVGPKQSRERVVSRNRARKRTQPPPDRGNWVMRGSAGPGYVILQRTNPPYERKVVPGQAF